jgi:hypothetical protein
MAALSCKVLIIETTASDNNCHKLTKKFERRTAAFAAGRVKTNIDHVSV